MYWLNNIISNNEAVFNIDDLEQYMFNKKHLLLLPTNNELETINNENPVELVVEEIVEVDVKSKLLYPKKCQDPLFWCLYIAKYGMNHYKENATGNIEMKEKQMVCDTFFKMGTKQLNSILETKITKIATGNIVNDILTLPRIHCDTINAFCSVYNFNVYIVDNANSTYISYLRKDDSDNVIIYKGGISEPKFMVDISENMHSLSYIKNNFVQLEKHDKPLKAMTNYKVSVLEMMAHKLGLELENGIKKTQLYEKIIMHCLWKTGKQ